MKRAAGVVCAGLIGVAASYTTIAQGRPARSFQRVGTFANYTNLAVGDQTVSEITAATADGKTLVYTDAVTGRIGFIDIKNPAQPAPDGTLVIDPNPQDDVDYTPTSVDVLGNKYALVAADTSASKTDTSGSLLVIDLVTRHVVSEIDLGGQPDSVRISPNHQYVAVAIENERDEELCVGGADNGDEIVDEDDYQGEEGTTTEDLCEDVGGVPGGLPQTSFGNPAGYLAVVETAGHPTSWVSHAVPLTGIADLYPTDPEPEFVDINDANQAVVTLQENNHLVIVDLKTRMVIGDFSAGTVSLTGIDTDDDFVIVMDDTLTNVPREPDAVTWIGGSRLATANEGDLDGGSRGFTLFTTGGAVVFDSGSSFERLAVRHGHYPEDRSDNKGTEPESIEFARFGADDLIFVGSERGSFVAVYRLNGAGSPEFLQLLPAPLGPEGLLTIPHRNLLVASGEEDDPSFGVRSSVMLYELKAGAPAYPQIRSASALGSPTPWSALSGMTDIPGVYDQVLAVWDSYYSQSRIFTMDVSQAPAVITGAVTITGAAGALDPEGIASAPDGTVWVVSEGNATDSRPNLLLQVNPTTGAVIGAPVGLPANVLACRTAERSVAGTNGSATFGSGFEGVDVLNMGGGQYRLYIAQQRGWNYTTPACEALDDDPADVDAAEPTWTRIWIYDPFAGGAVDSRWSHVPWQLQPKPQNVSWVGLSEITRTDTGWVLIERDNRTGSFGVLKTLASVSDADAAGGFTNVEKSFFDLRPRLLATNGWITDKPEGVAILDNGETFVVTDNDGVEDWSGETWFFGLGRYWTLFDD